MSGNLSSFLLAIALCLTWVKSGSPHLFRPGSQDPGKQDQTQQDKDKKKDQQKKDQQQKGQQGANQQQQQQNPPPKQGDNKPAPLFGGTLDLKSSRQTKDSATLGFNGVDPNGQVQKSFLSASASGTDNDKAAQIAGYKVSDADLAQFIQDGGLNRVPPPAKSSN